jgi:S-adenosylmethionine hydrolase
MSALPLIALITDFGIEDSYAGVLHGVLLGAIPQLRVVDVTHSVPCGDVRRGGLVLWEAQPFFPRGTIFLAVVDPGVGSRRRGLIFHFPDCDVVCPDNGMITDLMHRFKEWKSVEISNPSFRPAEVSNTFHGRDVFAPAVVELARGTALKEFGGEVEDPERLAMPRLSGNGDAGWEGEVLYTDHFGNAITSLGRVSCDGRNMQPWFPSGADGGLLGAEAHLLLDDGTRVPILHSYTEGRRNGLLTAVVGSSGLLEVAAWQTPASNHPSLKPGCRVRLIP